jgi:hypothetical protein
MANTIQREAVDIAPMRARPALALVLALLSIPGSTLAWDLPSGGIWIGLPLGIAAIVLGLQARRRLGHSSMAVAAIAISVLMIGMMVVWKIVELVS